MNLIKVCTETLDQLTDIVQQIHHEDFIKPIASLSNASIGQHLRHTLEFFLCFERGFQHGTVNYDRRAHDTIIETDKHIAIDTLNRVRSFIGELNLNKLLKLEVNYDLSREDFIATDTNAMRELIYNIEHAVHHMAIIKIGIREIAPYVQLPEHFGIAASSVRYKNGVTQAGR